MFVSVAVKWKDGDCGTRRYRLAKLWSQSLGGWTARSRYDKHEDSGDACQPAQIGNSVRSKLHSTPAGRLSEIFLIGLWLFWTMQPVLAQSDLPDLMPLPAAQPRSAPLAGTALDPVVRLGQKLLDSGILPRLRYVNSFAANPIGGLGQGAEDSGAVIFGADFDMAKIAGIPGGLIHLSFADFYGHELAGAQIGTRTKVQSLYYPNKQFELSEFTYEQSFWNDRLNLLAGRANATGEFARSTYGCRFENVADCPFELTQFIGGFPGFPYVNWGGRARVSFTPETYFKVGAYEINSLRNRTTGFDWSTDSSTGYVIPAEIGYETGFDTDRLPRHYKAGFWYNSAPYADPLLNTRGTSRAQFGGTALTHTGGRRGAYILGDQMLWRPDNTSTRGIAAFGGMAAPADHDEAFSLQAIGGAVWTGPFAARPFDQIGLLGSYIQLSSKETSYLNGLLKKARSNSFIARDGFVIELNYGIEIVPGINLQPTLQYLIHPDDISRPTAKMAPRDALVVGLKLSINGGSLLGLPQTLPGRRRPGG